MRKITRFFALAAIAGVVLSSIALPARAAAIPNPADDKAEAYVQLSGLTVDALAYPAQVGPSANGLQAVISATAPSPRCIMYNSGASTLAFPCMTDMLQRQYQINVYGSTTLLDLNRKKIVLGDIKVGDTINAYGTIPPTGNTGTTMNALIVRDLSVPMTKTFVQLENLNILAMSYSAETGEMRIDAARPETGCWKFSTNSSRLSYPCPMGMEPADNVRASLESAASAMGIRNMGYYHIVVPKTAQVLGVNRRPLDRSKVVAGDKINVYGILTGQGTVTALILRDLTSKTFFSELSIKVISGGAQLTQNAEAKIVFGAAGGTAPYTWSATGVPDGMTFEGNLGGVVNCIVAPCPQPVNDQARLIGAPTKPGTYAFSVDVKDANGNGRYISVPLTVATGTSQTQGLLVTVKTDSPTYVPGAKVGIDVTVSNSSKKAQTIQFKNGCQADYQVLPNYRLWDSQVCTDALTSITIPGLGSKTYHFDYNLAELSTFKTTYPMTLTIVGRVIGVGEDSTKITVNYPIR
jgi:hypothetical protein